MKFEAIKFNILEDLAIQSQVNFWGHPVYLLLNQNKKEINKEV